MTPAPRCRRPRRCSAYRESVRCKPFEIADFKFNQISLTSLTRQGGAWSVHAACILKDNAQKNASQRPGYAEVDPQAARAALTGFADVTVVIDRQGYILSISAPAGSTLPAAVGLADGLDFRETLMRDCLGKAQELIEDAAAGEIGRARELNHKTQSGAPYSIQYQAIRQGRNGDILLIGRDLSPLSELQQRLLQAQQATDRDYSRIRAMETRYRVLFQLSHEPMLIADAVTRKVAEANNACLAAFNLPLNRIVGRSLQALFDEHDGDALAALISNAMAGGEAKPATLRAAAGEAQYRTTVNLFRQDGASHLLMRPMPAAPGHFAANDATFLHALLERLPEGFVVTDGNGSVVEANRRFLDLAELPTLGAAAGRSLDEWVGRPGIDFGVLLAALRDSGVVRGFVTVLRGAYGSSETVEVSAVALFDHAEQRLGFLIRGGTGEAAAEGGLPAAIPRSVEQMKQLVGSVPMKELVRETADMIERLCIEAALELTRDNRASAAEMLGLSRQSLYAKLHRFGIGDLSAGSES
ncbi:MAG: transcriptional regulator PpsR [Beijerinckiaceae bacterium]